MINKKMVADAEKLTDKLVNSMPMAGLRQKLKDASPEERAQMKEISMGISANIKSGGLKGGLKYLAHIRPQL